MPEPAEHGGPGGTPASPSPSEILDAALGVDPEQAGEPAGAATVRASPADYAADLALGGVPPPGALLEPGGLNYTPSPNAVRELLIAEGKGYLWAPYETLQHLIWLDRRDNAPGHLEIEPGELVAQLRVKLGRSRATIYRYLAWFEVLGLVTRAAAPGRARFGPKAVLVVELRHYVVTQIEAKERRDWQTRPPRRFRGRAKGRPRAHSPPAKR